MEPGRSGMDTISLPPLRPWMRNLLIALFVLYLVEIVAANFLHLPVYTLGWAQIGAGMQPWQLLTHYLVQGAGRSGAFSVVLSLLVLYFFLPALADLLSPRHFAWGVVAAAVGGLVLGLAADLALPLRGGALGWSPLPGGMVVLFGLAMPRGVIRLFFVIPITGRWIVLGTVFLMALFVIAEPTIDTTEHLGAVLGPIVWWSWRGPGQRRRELKAKAKDIERELRRFEVIDGGRSDDDLVH